MTAIPTPEEFVARARRLKERLRARAEECERLRRLPEATVADYLDLEFHRMMQPKRFGGCEYGWDLMCECVNEWAQGCGSQAWALQIHTEYVHFIGMCPPQIQDDVWGDDRQALVSSSFQPTAKVEKRDGGYAISGRWGFSSGIEEAKWLIVGGILPGRGHCYFIVPRAEAKIIDDWYVCGLAGTGSKSFTLDGAFVPEHRIVSDQHLTDGQVPGAAPDAAPVYRFPRKAAAGLSLASVPVGVAIAMLEDFKDAARDRVARERAPADQATALRIAECAAELDIAKWATIGTARECMRVLREGRSLTREERLTSRRNAGVAAMMTQRASERMFAAVASAATRKSSRIQRAFRDIHAAANHMGVSWEIAGTGYGEHMMGLDPAPGMW